MTNLTNFDYNGKLIQCREDKYFNLTQMCQANEKLISDFLRLKSTKAYLNQLSSDMGIPISELIDIVTGGQHWEQGTWGHKYIAIKLARWVSVEFEIWCDKNIFTLMNTGKVEIKTKESDRDRLEKQLLPTPTLKQVDEAANILGKRFGTLYEQRYVLQQFEKHYPQLAGETPQPQEMASLPTVAVLLTPTQIAEQLEWYYSTGNPNPRKVNSMLEQLGYQVKIDKQWSATDKAINANLCDRKPVETNSKTQKDQLLWSDKVIDILAEHSVSKL